MEEAVIYAGYYSILDEFFNPYIWVEIVSWIKRMAEYGTSSITSCKGAGWIPVPTGNDHTGHGILSDPVHDSSVVYHY